MNKDYIIEALKKNKKAKSEDREFDIMQLYNYLKSYIIAKFKVPEIKIREVKLDTNYFKVILVTQKEKFDPVSVSDAIRKSLSLKFEVHEDDVKVLVSGNSNKENMMIDIEYIKKVNL
jgi:hypothetical protein